MYETTTRAQAIDFHHIRTTGEMSSIDMTIIVHAPVIAGLIGGTECPIRVRIRVRVSRWVAPSAHLHEQ